jgi:fused signal recognition particle receptor
MFGFLKKKLSEAVGKFTKKAEEEVPAEIDVKKELLPAKTEAVKEEKPVKLQEKKPQSKDKLANAEEAKAEKKKTAKKDNKQPIEKSEEEPQAERIAPEEPAKPAVIKEEETVTEEEPKEEKKSSVPEKPEERKGFFSKIFGRKEQKEQKVDVKKATVTIQEETEHEKPGILGKISDSFTKITLSDDKFNELFWDLELSLMENNVAVQVIEKIKEDLRNDLVDKRLTRSNLEHIVQKSLHDSIEDLFNADAINLIETCKKKKPYVIVLIGINGSGKTTTLAKLINLFNKNHLEVVVGACDTFRAAAIQQLEEHTIKLGVKLIKHDYGSDPAAVAFDAVKHAEAKGKDVVLLDTAGRLHSNKNLMTELEKVIRVAKPDMKIFVGESIAGNDVVEQVKLFNDSVGIDGIILSKADVDEKGGAAISVSYITGKPIMYLGVGQNYDDLVEFNKDKIVEQIGL